LLSGWLLGTAGAPIMCVPQFSVVAWFCGGTDDDDGGGGGVGDANGFSSGDDWFWLLLFMLCVRGRDKSLWWEIQNKVEWIM